MNNKLYEEKKEEVKVEPEEFLLTGVDKKIIFWNKKIDKKVSDKVSERVREKVGRKGG